MPGRVKQRLVTLHRYLGLALLGFLLVISFSGFSLVFQHEWDALINPGLYAVEAPDRESLPVDALVSSVEDELPQAYITYLPLVSSSSRAQVVYVAARTDPLSGEEYAIDYDEAFLDHSSGRVNGVRQWGECCDRANVLPLLYKVHNRLLLPSSTGHYLMAGIALLWLALSLAGLYLVLSNRRFNLRWRRGMSGRPALLQLHRQAGFWSLPFMLVIIVTGLSMVLEDELTRPVLGAFAAAPEQRWAAQDEAQAGQQISYGRAVEIARAQLQRVENTAVEAVAIDYSASRNQFAVELAVGGLPALAPHEVYISAGSGEVLGIRQVAAVENRLMDNRAKLHSGSMFGLPGRVLAAATAVIVFTLSLSGLLMWRARRASGS